MAIPLKRRHTKHRAAPARHNYDDGASYSLTYVMAFPIVAMLVAVMLESMLLMLAKQGTQYAAYAAARSAAVWVDAEPNDDWIDKPIKAGKRAMIGVASGSPHHAILLQPRIVSNLSLARDEQMLLAAFKLASESTDLSDAYLRRKIRTAYLQTDVSIREEPVANISKPREDNVRGNPGADGTVMIATIRYRAPIHVPVVGRIFGTRDPITKLRYWEITSEAAIPREKPRSANGTLGIDYRSR